MSIWWVIVALLLVTTGVMMWRDPRRLRCAVVLGLAVQLIVLLVATRMLEWITRQEQRLAAYGLLAVFALALIALLVMALLSIQSGVVLLRKEGFGLAHSLTLLLGVALIVYLGAVIAAVLHSKVQLLAILLAAGMPLSYLAWLLVCFLVYQAIYRVIATRFVPSSHTVVVLGAGLRGTDVTPLLGRRLDLGIKSYNRIANDGVTPLFVVSGGQGPGEEISEAQAMKNYVRQRADIQVIEENASTNTEQNLRFSSALVPRPQSEPWLVVTSDFHAFRAANLLSRLGISGGAIGAWTPRYFWGAAILREYAALLRDHMKLNVIFLVATCLPLMIFMVTMLLRGAFG